MKLKELTINNYLFQLGLIKENSVGLHFCPYRDEKNKSFLILKNGKGFRDMSQDDKACNIFTLVERLGIATIPKSRRRDEWQEFTDTALNAIGATSETYQPPKDTTKNTKAKTKREYNVENITDTRLMNYCLSRGVSKKIIEKLQDDGHIQQVNIKSNKTGRFYSYVGFKNVNGGFSCRNKFMKSSIGKSGIAKIIGEKYTFYIANSTSNIELVLKDIEEKGVKSSVIFEGFFDFLSFVSSKVCLSWLSEDTINLALDNGQGGDIATIKVKLTGKENKDLRARYRDYEDVNDFIMGKKSIGKYPRFNYSNNRLVSKKTKDDYHVAWENPKDVMGIINHLITTNKNY